MCYNIFMKKFLLTIFIILFSISSANASEFCAGFEQGYVRGYQQAKNTNLRPFVPFCPFQPMKGYGDPSSDFEHGYIIGLKKGMSVY
jgi:hypothetical protein